MTKQQTEALKPLILAFTDRIDGPWRGAGDIEPMEVRDYRHSIYRDWEPLCRAIMAALATPSTAPSDTLERREAIARVKAALADADKLDSIGVMVKSADLHAILALTTSPRVDEGRALRREGIVAFSADIENPRVLKLHFDQNVTSAHRSLILDAINARRAALATTPAPREKLEADLVEAVKSGPVQLCTFDNCSRNIALEGECGPYCRNRS